MTIAQLKEALTERGVKFKTSCRKTDLQKLLKDAVKNSIKIIYNL